MKSKFSLDFKNWKSLLALPAKTKLLLLFLIGLLLLIIAIPSKTPDISTDISDNNTPNDSNNDLDTSALYANEYEEYESLLETRMEDILEEVQDVGKVSVMITLKSSSEQVIEKDTVIDSQTSESDTQNSSSKTSIYTEDSDGKRNPYVKKIYTPTVEGVIVIAEGGDNQIVVKNITESIQALFGVDAHKIKIMKRVTS